MWLIQEYADDFYDNGNYGMGEDFSGMLILVDMNNRIVIISCGGVMIDYITEMREEDIIDQAYSFLSYGAYGNAMIAALNRVEDYMNKGRAEGTFRYDEVTGQRIGGIYNALTMAEICLAGLAGGIAALLVFLSVSGSYNLSGRTYSYDLNANSDLQMTQDDEVFVRQFQRRTLRNTGGNGSMGGSGGSRSGGTGVHRSSSGRMHSGGGRRF
jgi:uncharacterized protein